MTLKKLIVFLCSIAFISIILVWLLPLLSIIILSVLWITQMPTVARHFKEDKENNRKKLLAFATFSGGMTALNLYPGFVNFLVWTTWIFLGVLPIACILESIIGSIQNKVWRKKYAVELAEIHLLKDKVNASPYVSSFVERTDDEEVLQKEQNCLREEIYAMEKKIGLHNTKAFKKGIPPTTMFVSTG